MNCEKEVTVELSSLELVEEGVRVLVDVSIAVLPEDPLSVMVEEVSTTEEVSEVVVELDVVVESSDDVVVLPPVERLTCLFSRLAIAESNGSPRTMEVDARTRRRMEDRRGILGDVLMAKKEIVFVGKYVPDRPKGKRSAC